MKFCFFLIISALTLTIDINAQQNDSINQDAEQVSISLDNLIRLKIEKDKACKALDSIKSVCDKLLAECQQTKLKLSDLNIENERIKTENLIFTQHINKTDTCLIDMASNFLYIPYEAYSVEKIAIPAFENIYSKELKSKRLIKYDLLKSYQSDIRELSQYLTYVQTEISKPFTKDGITIIEQLEKERFYINYIKYSDYENTFIGKFLSEILNNLKTFNKKQLITETGYIKKELDNCLKTIDDL